MTWRDWTSADWERVIASADQMVSAPCPVCRRVMPVHGLTPDGPTVEAAADHLRRHNEERLVKELGTTLLGVIRSGGPGREWTFEVGGDERWPKGYTVAVRPRR